MEVAKMKMKMSVTKMDKILIENIRRTVHVRCCGDKVSEARLR